jgi:hypothetical protein
MCCGSAGSRHSRAGVGALLPFEVRLAVPPAEWAELDPGRRGRPSGLKLSMDAHASISVPSTLKCSFDNSRFTANSNCATTSPSSRRSRFSENVE